MIYQPINSIIYVFKRQRGNKSYFHDSTVSDVKGSTRTSDNKAKMKEKMKERKRTTKTTRTTTIQTGFVDQY